MRVGIPIQYIGTPCQCGYFNTAMEQSGLRNEKSIESYQKSERDRLRDLAHITYRKFNEKPFEPDMIIFDSLPMISGPLIDESPEAKARREKLAQELREKLAQEFSDQCGTKYNIFTGGNGDGVESQTTSGN
jgi:hypothetical protein